MASNRLGGWVKAAFTLMVVLRFSVAPLQAQKEPVPPARVEATRAELEAIAAHPPQGMSAADLEAVQARLAKGDFAVGDRLLITVAGEASLSDTFSVQAGQILQLPNFPPLALAGVLRSESDSVISIFLGKYLRDPQMTVVPLIRLGVLGGVARPGYYDVPAQSLLSEVIMSAGGLGAFGYMPRSKVNRGNAEVLNPKATNMAIANGSTLDLLNLQSGDNFNVGVQNPGATYNKVQIVTALLAIPLMIVTISTLAH
jgi:protein involved in polysaccharide export with SLBB domain